MAGKLKIDVDGMTVEIWDASFEVTSSNGRLRSGNIFFDRNNPAESAARITRALVFIGKEEARIEFRNMLGV